MKRNRIAKKDWELVVDYACKIVNASSRKDRVAGKAHNAALHSYLKRLLRKYGPRAAIVETQGDFTGNCRQRLSLYKRAYSLAEEQADYYTLASSSVSLAEIYIEDMRDRKNASIWLMKLKSVLNGHPDEDFAEKYATLSKMIKKSSRRKRPPRRRKQLS